MTAGGLLVWRKVDNFTAFTDGYHTWVNGPFGLQRRLNGQHFWWEWNPEGLAVIPAPVLDERCHTAGLSLRSEPAGGATGHEAATFHFTNNLAVPCTLYGSVGLQMLDTQNNPVPTRVAGGSGSIFRDPGPALVTLPPRESASFTIDWLAVPVGNETSCPSATRLLVIPPGEPIPIVVPFEVAPCDGGLLRMTAIQPAGNLGRARVTLNDYLSALDEGRYNEALELYGGSYESLIEFNPSFAPDAKAALLKQACTVNGFQCLKVRSISAGRIVGPTEFEFRVEFERADGTLFVLTPLPSAAGPSDRGSP